MKNQINITDFTFEFVGHGHYRVIYTSPLSKKKYTGIISNMPLIDATKNADRPKIKDLLRLKKCIKGNY